MFLAHSQSHEGPYEVSVWWTRQASNRWLRHGEVADEGGFGGDLMVVISCPNTPQDGNVVVSKHRQRLFRDKPRRDPQGARDYLASLYRLEVAPLNFVAPLAWDSRRPRLLLESKCTYDA